METITQTIKGILNKMRVLKGNSNVGYLELILGPMFSGKTSALLDIHKYCEFCDIPIAVINHSCDKRYHDTMMSSHDQVRIPCHQVQDLFEIENKCDLSAVSVILINEGQFFSDLYSFVSKWVKAGKEIYVCGLDGDFERKKFGSLLDLIPLCDKVTKLTSICSICKDGTAGIFSMRLTAEKEQTVIGSDNYIPVCRKCYEEKSAN